MPITTELMMARRIMLKVPPVSHHLKVEVLMPDCVLLLARSVVHWS